MSKLAFFTEPRTPSFRGSRVASRGRTHFLRAIGLLAGLFTTVEITPGGSLTFAAGRDAQAMPLPCVTAGGGSSICEPGDTCSLTCPLGAPPANVSVWFDRWVDALVPQLWEQYNSSNVDHDDWDKVFDKGWEKTKSLYPASWAPYFGSLEEPLFTASIQGSYVYRAAMSEIFNVQNAKTTLTSTGLDLDVEYGEACGDTSPAYFDYKSSSLPGYYLVPSALTEQSIPLYECPDYLEELTQQVESYQVDDRYNGAHMGRLADDFRVAARAGDARQDLRSAAAMFRQGTGGNCEDAVVKGNAYADLAVTGRRSFASFSALVGMSGFQTALEDWLTSEDAKITKCGSPPSVEKAVQMAIDRAFHVANVLRVGSAFGTGQGMYRDSFGYIAVSGEDDPPYRPVNVPSAPFQQHDLNVTVPLRYAGGAKRIKTRYFIAESGAARENAALGLTLPSDPPPRLSGDAEVIIFLHGLGSRAEEGLDLTDALHARSAKDGKNYTVIAVDLPNQGYAEKFNAFEVSPLSTIGVAKSTLGLDDFDTGGHHHVPLLDFVEDFVVSFVDALDVANGGALKGKIRAVVGGSLGGNLALRLGRRQDIPWLRKVVAWSPGSAWESLADGADLLKHKGVRTAWEHAGGGDPMAQFYTNPPPGMLIPELPEAESARWEFFMTEFYRFATHPVPLIPVSQPHLWYRNDWPCFASTVQGDQLAVQETYHPLSRLSHWRLAAEQLVYSHASDPDLGHAPVLDNYIPTLLLTAGADNYPYAEIFDATSSRADEMQSTPGRFIRLGTPGQWSTIVESSENTGHAINNERPNLLATVMAKFLRHDYLVLP